MECLGYCQCFAECYLKSRGTPETTQVLVNAHSFRMQILLFHFTGPLVGGEGELHTAIEAVTMDELPVALQGWIDTAAICGRDDSKYVHIKVRLMYMWLHMLYSARGVAVTQELCTTQTVVRGARFAHWATSASRQSLRTWYHLIPCCYDTRFY